MDVHWYWIFKQLILAAGAVVVTGGVCLVTRIWLEGAWSDTLHERQFVGEGEWWEERDYVYVTSPNPIPKGLALLRLLLKPLWWAFFTAVCLAAVLSEGGGGRFDDDLILFSCLTLPGVLFGSEWFFTGIRSKRNDEFQRKITAEALLRAQSSVLHTVGPEVIEASRTSQEEVDQ